MKLPELLAPVGSAEHLKTAILSGANSIYLSGEKFGARQYAENFSLPEIREAIKYAHLHNVKVYVTVNTLIKENELIKVSEYLLELYKMGVDAVLIQDIGLIKIINENIPNLKIHASTQMNIHNIDGIAWASKHNIKRVVLPREIELEELKEIIEYAHDLNIEIETFVHGALCYSYSGQCLLSSFQGGRSGNRGTCAQPCREKYDLLINQKTIDSKTEGNYLLSPKDLCLYEHLDELVNLGVDSLKIEGRMRSNEYVGTVVKNYRIKLNKLRYDKTAKEINKNIKELSKKTKKGKKGRKSELKKVKDKEHILELKEKQRLKSRESLEELGIIFNREYTTGHLIPKNNPKIMNRKKPGHQGLFIGKIHRYNPQTEEIHILLKDNLINIPEKGDGILIETTPHYTNKSKENKKVKNKTNKNKTKRQHRKNNNQKIDRLNDNPNKTENTFKIETYGFDISSKPILKNSKDKHWRKREQDKDINGKLLVIKRVKANKKINFKLEKGYNVYLTKRNSLIKTVKDLPHNKDKHNIKKSILELYFRIDNENYPHLKGNLKLDDGKVITVTHKGERWEEAIKKPISNETIKKQLTKIGDLPYYIDKITIHNNNKKLFSPISKLNEIRREFFYKLENEIINSYKPQQKDVKITEKKIEELKEELSKKIDLKNMNNITQNKEYNLSIYINSLNQLKEINSKHLEEKTENIYNRVYLEIPPDKSFEEIIQNKIEKYNPLDSKELNISYCVNFLKEAIEISRNQKYKLIWKLPNITHKHAKESIIKIIGILNKIDLNINIMTSTIGLDDSLNEKFNLNVYGNHSLNVFNTKTITELDKYKVISISPELYKKNIEKIMENYYKIIKKGNKKLPEIELLIHGNIESMISRKEVISKKQLKHIQKYNKQNKNKLQTKEYYLKNKKNQKYPIKTSLNEDQTIILNSEELCLIDEMTYLKNIGINNFSIDWRWKSSEHIYEIGKIYKQIINDNNPNIDNNRLSKEIIKNYSPKLTEGNFKKGLK